MLYIWLLISNMLQRTEARRLDIREIWARSNINDLARDKLKEVWKGAYERYMKKFIPDFAKQLHEGNIPIYSIKTALRA